MGAESSLIPVPTFLGYLWFKHLKIFFQLLFDKCDMSQFKVCSLVLWYMLCNNMIAIEAVFIPLHHCKYNIIVQSLSCVLLFATPWTAAHQDFLSFTISQSLLKLVSVESVMSSNHLILCHPLLFLPSIFPSSRFFSNESALHIKMAKLLEL